MSRRPMSRRAPAIPGVHYRQGDVLLRAIDAGELPQHTLAVARQRGRIVLAEGEVTGHAHAVRAPWARLVRESGSRLGDSDGMTTSDGVTAGEPRRYLVLDAPADLVHEEHAAIDLPAGVFEVVIQREYVPAELPSGTFRRVVD